MCIVLLATASKRYPLVLLNNRDEYLSRPAAPAHFWHDFNGRLLGGRDLLRPEHGTWLGVTTDGRIAALTNHYEASNAAASCAPHSRGAVVTNFLTSSQTINDYVDQTSALGQEPAAWQCGQYSLLCGVIRPASRGYQHDKAARLEIRPLALVSHHTGDRSAHWTSMEEGYFGLSNSGYLSPWPKVTTGKALLRSVLENADKSNISKDKLVLELFDLLSTSTFPQADLKGQSGTLETLQHSIFIPPVLLAQDDCSETEHSDTCSNHQLPKGRTYGTQQQTVILVDTQGHLTFVERTLYDLEGKKHDAAQRDKHIEFDIEGWNVTELRL